MFLHLSVSPFVHGGSTSVHGWIHPQEQTPLGADPPGADPPGATPPQEQNSLGADPPGAEPPPPPVAVHAARYGQRAGQRAVHILLECILVGHKFSIRI